jgi:hypothetical protein
MLSRFLCAYLPTELFLTDQLDYVLFDELRHAGCDGLYKLNHTDEQENK